MALATCFAFYVNIVIPITKLLCKIKLNILLVSITLWDNVLSEPLNLILICNVWEFSDLV